ncbi:MAG: sodium-dependent transporter [Bacteroidetes bacterium]|nr:sodium-dependent transporter [Bacteroidota bacterium]
MDHQDLPPRDSFTSKFGVIAATAGSAIGLGNIWRFPYIAGENGGGAFLVVYLLFVLGIGIPVMMSEFVIGRRALLNPYGAFKKLAPGKPWFLIGLMGVGAAFMILVFYNTVAGWTLEYIYKSITNAFEGKTSAELTTMFDGFREGSMRPLLWMVVFMALTAWIVLAGVQKGIEKYTKILMPILLVLIIILAIRALTLPGASEGLSFLFKPDFSKISGKTVLVALGQAFFSLSIGMGTLITYGSYIRKKNNLANTALSVSLADTFVAILAGIAIFPAVFAFGIDPASGEKLVFIVLPEIFQLMPGGYIFSLLFFILLAVAALTSTISILEVVVIYFVEELKMVRKKATILAAASISAVGIFAAASWGWASDLTLFGLNIFQLTDFATVNILLPVGGFFIVIFIGWFLKAGIAGDELSNSGSLRVRYLSAFMFIVKFIAPIAIALVFLYNLGIL